MQQSSEVGHAVRFSRLDTVCMLTRWIVSESASYLSALRECATLFRTEQIERSTGTTREECSTQKHPGVI